VLRGLISGVFFGAVVAVLGVVVLSVVAPQPPGREPPQAPQVDAPEVMGALTPESAPVTAPAQPDADPVQPATVPDVVAPEAEAGAPVADQAPAPAPDLSPEPESANENGLSAPESAADVGDLPEAAAPVAIAAGQAPEAPAAPEDEALPDAATEPAAAASPPLADAAEPAQPAAEAVMSSPSLADAPSMAEDSAPVLAPTATPTAPTAPDAGEGAAPEVDATSRPVALPGLGGADTADEITAPELPDIAEEMESPLGTTAPQGGTLAVVTPEEDSLPVVPEASVAEPEVGAAAPVAPETPQEPTNAATTGNAPEVGLTGTAASVLPEGSGEVVVRRPESDDDSAAADEMAGVPAPLERYAAAVPRDAAGLPRMSVVLMDDGRLPSAATVVGAIPFPISVVLDPSAADAARRAQAYREADIEILALADLPEGAAVSDGMAAVETADAVLGEHIGLLTRGNVMGGTVTADVSRYLADRLARDGRGLVALSEGLATPMRYAGEAGLPAVEVYRDLGETTQDARVIRRFLDQAAFRARQQSGIVVLGRLRAETITALMLWSGSDRAKQVGLVPVSAVLRGE